MIPQGARKSQSHGENEKYGIPPIRRLRVFGHEFHMDIRFLVSGGLPSIVDFFAVEQSGMDYGCCKCSKRQSIIHCKGRSQEHGAICLVFFQIKGIVFG
jgi:hypothetical protein